MGAISAMNLRMFGKHVRYQAIIGLGLIGLCAGISALGYSLTTIAMRQLLEVEARTDAARWSSHLKSTMPDLAQIAAGSAPSQATRAIIDRTIAAGDFDSFKIYDTKGFLRLQSGQIEALDPAGQNITITHPGFSKALLGETESTLLSIVDRPAGLDRPNTTGFIASTMLPLKTDGKTVGWFLVNLDQTDLQNHFARITAQISAAICLLLIAPPIFGFWYRARTRAKLERTLAALGRRDLLTGFPLKSELLERIDAHFAKIEPNGPKSALIISELTGAATIARTHGLHMEEQVIRKGAARIAAIVAGHGSIAMAGRATFLVFIEDASDPMKVLSLAKDITLALAAEVELDQVKIACACHSGIALSGSDGKTATQLMRNAELATAAAREQETPGYGFFNPERAKESNRRLAIKNAVAEATEHHHFRLDFQPVYNTRTGELNGFEALIRLHDAELGNVSPAEFIPIAEEIGLINQIGAWALDEACRVAAQWPAHLMVAVNLSPSQFMSGTLVSDVRRALENNHYPSYRLEVEITEGTLMNHSEVVLRQLRILREMGIAVALDDFGTGYSSLSYLWKFPFSKLKIDRSFVNALDEAASAKGILRSIIKLGHGLGLTVTAEGIENTRQLNTLRELGCDLAQGFLLDRPAHVADLAAIILRNFANGLQRRTRESNSNKNAA